MDEDDGGGGAGRRVNTDGAAYEYGNNKMLAIQLKQHLPNLKLNVPLALGSNDILEIFSNVSAR